jgi:hypothetical protein
VSDELWNYHIGGCQVLNKYLEERKGKTLDDHIHYCRIVAAITHTNSMQEQGDELNKLVDMDLVLNS